jgi:hypothetical protein
MVAKQRNRRNTTFQLMYSCKSRNFARIELVVHANYNIDFFHKLELTNGDPSPTLAFFNQSSLDKVFNKEGNPQIQIFITQPLS